MMDDLVKRADEVLKDVTPGPWTLRPDDQILGVFDIGEGDWVECASNAGFEGYHICQTVGYYGAAEADARFIAAARELVPAMRDRIEADAKRIAELKEELQETQDLANALLLRRHLPVLRGEAISHASWMPNGGRSTRLWTSPAPPLKERSDGMATD